MPHTHTSYLELIKTVREIGMLKSVAGVLNWDEHTQLPPKGTEHRATQVSLLAKIIHEKFSSAHVGHLITEMEASDLLHDPQSDAAVNVRELRRDYDRAVRVPSSLVQEISRVAVLAQSAWAEARRKSSYGDFQPFLARILDLKREEAECVGYRTCPYDALLDEYEPGETTANLNVVFASLRDKLVALIGRIGASGRKTPLDILERYYPREAQEKFARMAAMKIGFDFQAGRLDTTVHPFCSDLGPGDTRLTTRYDENYFGDAFFGVMHEAGHGLYDQGLKPEYFGTPLGEAISLGIHESQSRTWENLVGRSGVFWKHFFPLVKDAFPAALAGVSEEQWVFAANDIRPSFIRVEADEATYNLHILLRFELEQALLHEDLQAADLPGAWNEKMKQYLGIVPLDDAHGCLQDIHWSMGAIGYFPTYTLGNLYAAQFFEQAQADLGDLDRQIAAGNFAPLLAWLRKNIHSHGRRYSAGQLVKKITGKELSSEPLLKHLGKKAREWYGV